MCKEQVLFIALCEYFKKIHVFVDNLICNSRSRLPQRIEHITSKLNEYSLRIG